MGSCISKCNPKKRCSFKYKEECNNVVVQDKLVISQAPPPISSPSSSHMPLSINKKSCAASISPTTSTTTTTTTSLSSFSCTCSHGSTFTSSSSSSSTASSSSLSSSKAERSSSFSNEFLWSCVKENPHIVRVDDIPVKESPAKPVHTKTRNQKLDSPPANNKQQSIPAQRVVRPSPPKKRARPNSPTLTRQKSFRREPSAAYSLPKNRTLITRSPSPSRRFNGENFKNVVVPNTTPRETYSKRAVGSRTNAVQPLMSPMRRLENIRPASPSSNSTSTSSRHSRSLKDRETTTWNNNYGSKIDEIAVGEVVSDMEIDSLPMEDISNPHISLDCFIFL